MTGGSNLVVASLMKVSESFVYKDSGVFVLPEKVCKIYAGKRIEEGASKKRNIET